MLDQPCWQFNQVLLYSSNKKGWYLRHIFSILVTHAHFFAKTIHMLKSHFSLPLAVRMYLFTKYFKWSITHYRHTFTIRPLSWMCGYKFKFTVHGLMINGTLKHLSHKCFRKHHPESITLKQVPDEVKALHSILNISLSLNLNTFSEVSQSFITGENVSSLFTL